MSTFSLVLIVILGISLLFSLLILATGMASSRSHQLVTRSSKHDSNQKVNNLMASDLQKLQNNRLSASNTAATSH